ncbi:MAG TPA: type IV pilus modification protein PilV [Thiohalobacter sp.]|nr:type IV pilus modification protein PilV [Thiohalobacter sp.]
MPSARRFRRPQHGFTLIELLIAVVVLSIGLLGLAALQAQALRNNQSAYHRTQATILAYDMIDRARANRQGFDNGNYHLPTATETPACLAAGCNAAQMAGNDMFEWAALVNSHLPGGEGVICRDDTPNDGTDAANPACDDVVTANHVIKLWWDDDGSGGNFDAEERIIVEFTP